MTAQELLETVRRSGIELAVRGDRLRIEAPRGTMTYELRQELAAHKAELIVELTAAAGLPPEGWPPESLDAERRFGGSYARLFRFLGREVETSQGPGRLEQVFAERVAVALVERPQVLTFLHPSEIWPPGLSRAAALPAPLEH